MNDNRINIGAMDSSMHFHDHQQEVTALLRKISGQDKEEPPGLKDHNYNTHWSKNPDPNIKTRPAKLLFMNNFPVIPANQNQTNASYGWKPSYDKPIDVEKADQDEPLTRILSFIKDSSETNDSRVSDIIVDDDSSDDPVLNHGADEEIADDLLNLDDSLWTPLMKKLWARTLEILDSDTLARLTYANHSNELILKKNLTERTANKFRVLFSTVAFWDVPVLQWLNKTLIENVPKRTIVGYHESMQFLRPKLGYMLERIYDFGANPASKSRIGPVISDKLHALINNYKPKRLPSSPLFLIVPSGGPQTAHHILPMRTKYWHNLFGSLGKVITFSFTSKPGRRIYEYLGEIRGAVRDKIRECRSLFSEGRPLFLVGFGHSSLIAAHCALENSAAVRGIICLGFPLSTINGFRGDLDDPLLELACPTLFIVGQNSATVSIDDIEDFRERITKAETGLVVVGGANDQLLISSEKKKFEAINQSMVDRAITDEIHDFVNSIIMPHDAHGVYGISNRMQEPPASHQSQPSTVSPLVKRHHSVESNDVKFSTSSPKLGTKSGSHHGQSSQLDSAPKNPTPTGSASGKMRGNVKLKTYKSLEEPLHQNNHTPAKRIKSESSPTSGLVALGSGQGSLTPSHIRSSSGGSSSGTRRSNSPLSTQLNTNSTLSPATNGKSSKDSPASSSSVPLSLENIKEENEDNTGTKREAPDHVVEHESKRVEPSSTEASADTNLSASITTHSATNTPTGVGSRHYGFSYGVAEVPSVLSQTATRTGRQIRPPKNLDV